MKITRIMSLLFFLLSGATQLTAQDTPTQDEVMRRLQSQMDELRARMNEIQAQLDALHGVNNLANANKNTKPVPQSLQTGAIERTMPPLPPPVQLTPEQQHEAVGKETAEYQTFSNESEAVCCPYQLIITIAPLTVVMASALTFVIRPFTSVCIWPSMLIIIPLMVTPI